MKRHFSTFQEKYKMLTLIGENILGPHADHTYTYVLGWSDERVAAEISAATLPAIAASIRLAEFGKLSRLPASTPFPTPTRIDLVEERIARIIDYLAGESPNAAHYRRVLLHGPNAPATIDEL